MPALPVCPPRQATRTLDMTNLQHSCCRSAMHDGGAAPLAHRPSAAYRRTPHAASVKAELVHAARRRQLQPADSRCSADDKDRSGQPAAVQRCRMCQCSLGSATPSGTRWHSSSRLRTSRCPCLPRGRSSHRVASSSLSVQSLTDTAGGGGGGWGRGYGGGSNGRGGADSIAAALAAAEAQQGSAREEVLMLDVGGERADWPIEADTLWQDTTFLYTGPGLTSTWRRHEVRWVRHARAKAARAGTGRAEGQTRSPL